MLVNLSLALSIAAIALSVFSLAYTRKARWIIAEGFASAASIHAATGAPVAVVPDPWIETIREWLAIDPADVLTPNAILAGALPGTPSTRATQVRITAAMKALGYRATRVKLPDRETPVRVFQPVAQGDAA